ncbi:MAG TPA: biosynthetic peptidoglycan transglycosylase, partial [Anaerolineales bacterium]|nr:biosynthetic peptidoglycan transglycosylase [Anaerolineales bacterium]
MSDSDHAAFPEDPSDRFRRLISETEEEAENLPEDLPLDDNASTLVGEYPDPENRPASENGEVDRPDATAETPAEEVDGSSVTEIMDQEDIADRDENLTETRPSKPQLDPTGMDSSETRPSSPSRQNSGQAAPPPLNSTPASYRPALDTNGMPLPHRVHEIDLDATRVAPSAYGGVRSSRRSVTGPPSIPPPSMSNTAALPRDRSIDWKKGLGCLVRLAIVGLFFFVVVTLGVGSFLVYQYYTIAATLPDVNSLRQNAAQFETTRILDRNGNVLYEILDPTAGRRTYVSLDKISPYVVAATVATEDKDFYSHPGYDLMAIFRAFWQNYRSGETVSGASTITQQLARALLFSPEERGERSYQRKVREAILAAEVTRRYSKDEILELYLNEIYYGNLAYGIEAAAETYFGTSADKLTLSQAAFLAGLPQAPSVYDVYSNREVTLHRHEQVL